MRIILGKTSLDGLFKENKKYLSDLQYSPEDFHGLSADTPNMKPPVLWITVVVVPLLSHLSLKYDPFLPYCDPQYRIYKSPDTPSSDNQLSIRELWHLEKFLESISLYFKANNADSPVKY